MKNLELCLLELAAVAALAGPGAAQTSEFSARITGARGDTGKCTIEVVVDGSADVEIRGDRGTLRTLTGQPAQWRRFQCTGPLPANPGGFRFTGIDGRGRQELLRDPRSNRGVAIVRIEDAKGGAEGYTFDLEWGGEGFDRGPGGRGAREEGRGFWAAGGYATGDAISSCLRAVELRARRDGYAELRFATVRADDRPGRNDWIVGAARALSGRRISDLEFACSVNLDNGSVRSVDLVPR